MYESVEIWTLSSGVVPEVYNEIHDVYLSRGGALLVCFKNGDQLGIPVSNVRRWNLKKAAKE